MKKSAQISETPISHEDSAMRKTLMAVCVMSLFSTLALAQRPAENSTGIELKNYKGNTSAAEKAEVLKLKGNANAGKAAYKLYCATCHLPTGGGNSDGSIPQLAGQHATVLIKQLADIRSGLRYNPTMYPFARKLKDAQAVADVAAYVATLCIPGGSGGFQGTDAAKTIADGNALYEKECAQCHKAKGEGSKEMLYPVLAGQHYRYLLRQMTEIKTGTRVNIPPEMFAVITKYSDDQLVAIAAYQASLTIPNAMCKTVSPKTGT